MPDLLTAAQVQVMVRRWGRAQLVDAATLRQAWDDLDALTRQDAAWRALVGGLMPYLRHPRSCVSSALTPCTCGLHAWLVQAQAALDGTPA